MFKISYRYYNESEYREYSEVDTLRDLQRDVAYVAGLAEVSDIHIEDSSLE